MPLYHPQFLPPLLDCRPGRSAPPRLATPLHFLDYRHVLTESYILIRMVNWRLSLSADTNGSQFSFVILVPVNRSGVTFVLLLMLLLMIMILTATSQTMLKLTAKYLYFLNFTLLLLAITNMRQYFAGL